MKYIVKVGARGIRRANFSELYNGTCVSEFLSKCQLWIIHSSAFLIVGGLNFCQWSEFLKVTTLDRT